MRFYACRQCHTVCIPYISPFCASIIIRARHQAALEYFNIFLINKSRKTLQYSHIPCYIFVIRRKIGVRVLQSACSGKSQRAELSILFYRRKPQSSLFLIGQSAQRMFKTAISNAEGPLFEIGRVC